jgi:nicotinate dehydrogenase subunit A
VTDVKLQVNGADREVATEPDTTLLIALRNHLGLKGTRFGCGLGLCGSCTVLVDGAPVHSCDTPLWSVEGKPITTVEGLSRSGRPHPVQQAFVDEQAAQCGYCVSGIVMRAVALLETNSRPSEQEVRAALDDMLCRCGAHNRMVRAVLRAAQSIREER